MTKREVVRMVYEGKQPPYIPWSFSFCWEAYYKLVDHYGTEEMESIYQNHIYTMNNGFKQDNLEDGIFKDVFGVIWDRSLDKNTGMPKGALLPNPTLDGYNFPDLTLRYDFSTFPEQIKNHENQWLVFNGGSLYERAWYMRGMENLMMDFIENPKFVHELLNAIADCNIAAIRKACEFDIDAVHFGDDWGQQSGLIMGPDIWHEFIYPPLKRMFDAVRECGKYISIHSCGDVDELFDDLVDIGLNCFNPFQSEVMDVEALMKEYHGRLHFYGGLSTQRTLPNGSVDDVLAEMHQLLKWGKNGGYIFAPAHAVQGDVPIENMVAFIEEIRKQPNYKNNI